MQIVKRKRAQATPHLYIDFIPFTTGSKRGLETRVSLKKALEALGFPLNMRYADTTEGRLIPIPGPQKTSFSVAGRMAGRLCSSVLPQSGQRSDNDSALKQFFVESLLLS